MQTRVAMQTILQALFAKMGHLLEWQKKALHS